MNIKSVIIDDERIARESLKKLLDKYATDVEVIGYADSAFNGIREIKKCQPDLIFLDIEMSGGSGFEMLDAMDQINFDVIFVTGHAEFAVRAFKYEALDFLLKPVDPDELDRAIEKHRKRVTEKDKLDHRLGLVKALSLMNSKVPLPHKDGVRFMEVGDVIRLEADGSYVTIYSEKERPQVVSKPLKFYASFLNEEVFLRVHRSHMVNVKYVREFKREGGGYILLSNGETVQVAEKKRDMVLKKLSR